VDPNRAGRSNKKSTAETRPVKGTAGLEPSQEADQELKELKDIDRKVRAHEAAHLSAGAGLVRGGASYTYRLGADGQLYAVGGEVTLDTSAVPGDPRATVVKMQQVQAAALAPADPSAQDRAVAAAAAMAAAKAQVEASREAADKASGQAEHLDLLV
jgi:hypothetical protein